MKDSIFILDDRIDRSKVFRSISLDTGLPHRMYKNFLDAKTNFLRADPKVVFIEYDLLITKSEHSKNKDGLEFATWLVTNDKELANRKIVIHSVDQTKASSIKKIIPSAKVIPFTKFSKDRAILYSSGALTKK